MTVSQPFDTYFTGNAAQTSVCPVVGSNSYSSSSATFDFSNVTPQDVCNAINKIKSNSTGLDGIHLRFIKIFIHLILSHISQALEMVTKLLVFWIVLGR
jgi:hypothetical protein